MGDGGGLTDDRKVLEMQVLTVRGTVMMSPPQVDEAQFQKNLEKRRSSRKWRTSRSRTTRRASCGSRRKKRSGPALAATCARARS